MSDPIDQRIDRFEQHLRFRVLGIAEALAGCFERGVGSLSESGFFILSGIASYFETINQFLKGASSEGKSKQFFREGFKAVYASSPLTPEEINGIYEWLRCGLYHSTMPKRDTYLDRNCSVGIRRDCGKLIINPAQLVREIRKHFEDYIAELRKPTNKTLRENFDKMAVPLERNIAGAIIVDGVPTPTTGTPPPMMSGVQHFPPK
jgi:hypothetical protein